MDVASDYCDIVKDQRQVNTLHGSNVQFINVNESRQGANVPMQMSESVVRMNTEPRTSRDVWIRLRQYKWTILAFVCGVILTLVVIVPVMVSTSSSTENVLEVGVASRKEIDSKHYVGNHGWSFFINNCNTSICLIAKHGTTNTREEVKMIDTTNSVGRVDTGILGFFVNTERNDYSVIDKDSSNILYTFTKVVSADQLCLAFGVYNPKTFETKLEIMYAYDFKNLPIINVIA
ncbi:Hypothetical predicted protein [Mytilus galloprovincialis]|uniref:Uncharacterized protein n=1 Tax=Mytilus galloprovincialis TaxID=29158 RepID=A0A8B6DDC2_MYTGA|nr:Hypothetical predicted protein [Mytilus galloprovincialis]